MSSMDYHILRIAENAESISTLYFRPPGSFTNAIITQPEITNIIRDADSNERRLFRVEDQAARKIARNKSIFNRDITKTLDNASQHNADQPGRLDGVNIDALCGAINDIVKDYPISGIIEKTSQYQKQWRELTESISHYEDLLTTQEQRINELNLQIQTTQVDRETGDLALTDTSILQQIEEMKKNIAQQQAELEQKESSLDDNTVRSRKH